MDPKDVEESLIEEPKKLKRNLYERIWIKFQLYVIETHIQRKLTQPKNLGACTYAGIEKLMC